MFTLDELVWIKSRVYGLYDSDEIIKGIDAELDKEIAKGNNASSERILTLELSRDLRISQLAEQIKEEYFENLGLE